ncbi:IS66 family transposase [Allisonella histaminiformans]|uniref:IS66 family transposase n=1 Tax=Allisonella histaminiformans TaxID=209880 RepID=UPI003C6D626C
MKSKKEKSTKSKSAPSNRNGLTCYLKDGHCDISNNTAENSIRPFTVGGKTGFLVTAPREPKPVLSSTA